MAGAATRPPRRIRRLAIALAGAATVWVGSSAAVAYRFTRRGEPPRPEREPVLAGVAVTTERLATADGETVGAWWLRGPDAAGGPGVVLLHGRSGTRASRLPHARVFLDQGCAVLAVTLRAHGDSTGERNDVGWSARHDVVAAVDFLEREHPGRPVVVCGASMGAAAAVFAAGELGERVAAYVLECPYRDLRSAVRHRTRIYLPPVLDALAARSLELVGPWVLGDVDAIAPIAHVGAIPDGTPVHYLAGGRDRRAPLDEVRELCTATGPAARVVVFETATHDALLPADPALYARTVAEVVAGLGRHGRLESQGSEGR